MDHAIGCMDVSTPRTSGTHKRKLASIIDDKMSPEFTQSPKRQPAGSTTHGWTNGTASKTITGATLPFRRHRPRVSTDIEQSSLVPVESSGPYLTNNDPRTCNGSVDSCGNDRVSEKSYGSSGEVESDKSSRTNMDRTPIAVLKARSISIELQVAQDRVDMLQSHVASRCSELVELAGPGTDELATLWTKREEAVKAAALCRRELECAEKRVADLERCMPQNIGQATNALGRLFGSSTAGAAPKMWKLLQDARTKVSEQEHLLVEAEAPLKRLDKKIRTLENKARSTIETSSAQTAKLDALKDGILQFHCDKQTMEAQIEKIRNELRVGLAQSTEFPIVWIVEFSDDSLQSQIRLSELRRSLKTRLAVLVDDQPCSLEDLVPSELRGHDNLIQHQGRYIRVPASFWTDSEQPFPTAYTPFLLLKASLSAYNESGLVFLPSAEDFRQRALGLDRSKMPPPPTHLKEVLRPYQLLGFQWLASLVENGMGGILADDMGLGKTLQAIALICFLKRKSWLVDANGYEAPLLIVVPATLIPNWRLELKRWAPELNVEVYFGKHRTISKASEVVISSYETCRQDMSSLCKLGWAGIVLDEAQRIKNHKAQVSKDVKRLLRNAGRTRIALSGTPIENRLEDLHSIMEFANPGFMGSRDEFTQAFGRPLQGKKDSKGIERQRVLFGQFVAPFILRRLKSDKSILPDLPDRVDYECFVELTDLQRRIYSHFVDEFKDRLNECDPVDPQRRCKRAGHIFELLEKLRAVCSHPACLSSCQLPSQFKSCIKDLGIPATSGKAAGLMELLARVLVNQVTIEGRVDCKEDKVLVFVTRKSVLPLLKNWIEDGFPHVRVLLYTGDVPLANRPSIEKQFREDPNSRVMLLTVGAGGAGLNLTCASHVVHFDRCYNPAKERQATDRAHRLGQKNVVCVHKFVTEGTYEERLHAVQRSKGELGSLLELDASGSWLCEYDDQELLDFFQLGSSRFSD